MSLKSISILLFFILISLISVESQSCTKGCDVAVASYYVWQGANLTFISEVLNSDISPSSAVNFDPILSYNPQLSSKDSVFADTRINVPFPCDCINGEFLGHVFQFDVRSGDTYDKIAGTYYANLTTVDWLQRFNSYPANNIPDSGTVNVTVNCSCGNAAVSKDYGLFITYPLRPGETLNDVLSQTNLTSDFSGLVQSYNPQANFSSGAGLVYVPGRDPSGNFPPLKSSKGFSGGVIAGIVVAAIVVLLLLAVGLYVGFFRKKKVKGATLLSTASQELSAQANVTGSKSAESTQGVALSPGLTGITVDKSVEFSYEELAQATDNFSLANKIGEGGFGAVYYAKLRGEEAAIKKMDMQASKEFLAELKVLTHVHHLNLVRLIGYCVEGSLFLVYEFIENGNLSQHLRGSSRDPLPWSTRVQIALDSARGLEYIHEHTVPVYIHRDIKSANILIDKNFHGKVADFGLTKLTEVGSTSLPTRLVGTFGYMPPEYAQYGDVSPKVDVYAFGVVLYELISAKEAIVKANGSMAESKGLVALFEDALTAPNPREELCKLIDQRLGEDYPLDSVFKMAQLAKACTQENPQLRPSMRSIVVALMTLSSSTEDWDVGSFYENQALVNLMQGSTSLDLLGCKFPLIYPEVADFGLTKLTQVKEAIVKANGSIAESKGLVALMAQLAKACTQENPQLRPSMRSVVVALMTLSS
ncbi:hypothetical protein COLO4_21849 [Corchorus olitorius]|uniref:non-specific serine/threonine protein kinase n=1 Tax=Corchorus olitorius TaxID=93759 RepID=A0A1R3IQB4_9ROSI|nr:hypothetical protein COLO4_21849 [Corchorus olitorius]